MPHERPSCRIGALVRAYSICCTASRAASLLALMPFRFFSVSASSSLTRFSSPYTMREDKHPKKTYMYQHTMNEPPCLVWCMSRVPLSAPLPFQAPPAPQHRPAATTQHIFEPPGRCCTCTIIEQLQEEAKGRHVPSRRPWPSRLESSASAQPVTWQKSFSTLHATLLMELSQCRSLALSCRFLSISWVLVLLLAWSCMRGALARVISRFNASMVSAQHPSVSMVHHGAASLWIRCCTHAVPRLPAPQAG